MLDEVLKFSPEIYSVVSTHPKCACGGRDVNNFEKKCLWRLPSSYFVCLTSLRVSKKSLKLQRRECFSYVPLIALHRIALERLWLQSRYHFGVGTNTHVWLQFA